MGNSFTIEHFSGLLRTSKGWFCVRAFVWRDPFAGWFEKKSKEGTPRFWLVPLHFDTNEGLAFQCRRFDLALLPFFSSRKAPKTRANSPKSPTIARFSVRDVSQQAHQEELAPQRAHEPEAAQEVLEAPGPQIRGHRGAGGCLVFFSWLRATQSGESWGGCHGKSGEHSI